MISILWVFVLLTYSAGIQPFAPPNTRIKMVIMNVYITFYLYGFVLVSTAYIYKKYNEQKRYKNCLHHDIPRFKLEDILCTKQGFDLFASHLVHEYSLENLGFIFEMMVIKSKCIESGYVYDISEFFMFTLFCVYLHSDYVVKRI